MQKIKDDLKKILSEVGRDLIGNSDDFLSEAFMAGGSIRSEIINERPHDYDVFLRSPLLVEKIKSTPMGGVFFSKNAATFDHFEKKIQVIINEFGEPDKIVSEFDFTMNMNYYCPKSDFLYVKCIDSVTNKKLKINPKCRNKIGTMVRIEKFLKRGYEIDGRMGLVELAIDISRENPVCSFDDLVTTSRLFFNDQDIDYLRAMDKISVPSKSEIDAKNNYNGSSY